MLKLASDKKSPVNYLVYARTLLKYHQPVSEVDKYIDKITVLEDKFDIYLECKSYSKAAEVGYKLRDSARLEAVCLRL